MTNYDNDTEEDFDRDGNYVGSPMRNQPRAYDSQDFDDRDGLESAKDTGKM